MSLFFPSHRNHQHFMNPFVTPYNHTPIPRFYPQLFSSFDGTFRELTKWADESHRLFGDVDNLPFAPKFNVKETDDAYQLEGELPGVKQSDLTVEFVNDTTLKVEGRTESIREEGTKPSTTTKNDSSAQMSGAIQPQVNTETGTATENDKASTAPSESGQPIAESTTETQPPLSQPAEAETQITKAETTVPSQTQSQTQPHTHWISERTIGTFQRTFSFPAKSIDYDSVKASLKDGVLSIVVPKLKNEEVESRKVELSSDSA